MVGRASITIPVAQEIFRFSQTNKAEAGPLDKWAPTQSSNALAAQYGITAKAVRDIWNKRTWVHATHTLWTEEEKSEYSRRRKLCDMCKIAVAGKGRMLQSCACRRLESSDRMTRGGSFGESGTPAEPNETCSQFLFESDDSDNFMDAIHGEIPHEDLPCNMALETDSSGLLQSADSSGFLQSADPSGFLQSASSSKQSPEHMSTSQQQSNDAMYRDGWMVCPDRIGLFVMNL